MRKFLLGALMALSLACSGKDTPTGPTPNPGTPPIGGDPIVPPPPPVIRKVAVRVYLPTNISDFIPDTSTSQFVVEAGNFKDSVLVVNGQASLTFPTTTPDTVKFTLSGNAQYPKVVAVIPKVFWDAQKDTVKIARISRKWKIRNGAYAGMEVATDPIRPYIKNEREGQMFWPRAGNNELGYWYPQLGWDLASFPVRIWIDADSSFKSSGSVITQSDYDDLRTTVDSLTRILGWSPFVVSNDSGPGSIRSVIWNNNTWRGIPFDEPSGGYFGGLFLVTKAARFRFAGVAIHEWLHILGFNHTCAWVGRMASGCTWTNPVDESHIDIAYVEQWLGVTTVRRKTGAQYHFGENLNGTLLELNREPDRIVYR